jgi:hypothetical protein
MDQKFINIISQFLPEEKVTSISPHGEGHIHETFLVETKDHDPDYILQKINHNIFRNIPGMMENIEAITRHFREKLGKMPGHDPGTEALTLVYTKSGKSWLNDKEGNFWRVYTYIPDTITYQQMADPALALEAGKAIGFFQAMLSDLQSPLVETIPDFHNIDFRISQYEQAKNANSDGRVEFVQGEMLFAGERFERMKSYYRSLKEMAAIRATHNDTKVNNVLFDRNNKAQCLIDLDTVMPGYVHFDYGDALRTMANTAPEDEQDLEKVHFNADIYHAFTKGYLQEAGSFLNQDEIRMLPYAPIYLTFIIGLRFLTDHLNGDIYFRIHHPGHNLDRARVQFKLVEEMERVLL